MIKLTPRLMLVADMVKKCSCFADIGTDHAYLAAFLVKNGIAQSAIASDINPNPLMNAQKTLLEEGLQEKITLRLSDGFKNIKSYEAQELAVAGMGGIMIADMINNTPWLCDKSKHLILQPMTHAENVRYALNENGFSIDCEKTVSEGKHTYIVISAYYTGNTEKKPSYWYYVGSLAASQNESDIEYVNKVLKGLKKRYDGLVKAEKNDSELLSLIRSIEYEQGN